MNWVWNGLTDDHISLAVEVNNSPGLSATTSDDLMNTSSLTEDHVSLAEPRYDFCTNSSSCINDGAIGNGHGLPTVRLEDSCSPLDELMVTACGDKLLYLIAGKFSGGKL